MLSRRRPEWRCGRNPLPMAILPFGQLRGLRRRQAGSVRLWLSLADVRAPLLSRFGRFTSRSFNGAPVSLHAAGNSAGCSKIDDTLDTSHSYPRVFARRVGRVLLEWQHAVGRYGYLIPRLRALKNNCWSCSAQGVAARLRAAYAQRQPPVAAKWYRITATPSPRRPASGRVPPRWLSLAAPGPPAAPAAPSEPRAGLTIDNDVVNFRR